MAPSIFDAQILQTLTSAVSSISFPDKANITDNIQQITNNATNAFTNASSLALAYVIDAEKAAVHKAQQKITTAVDTTVQKKNNVVSFTRAAHATIIDPKKPLADVPIPVIDHRKFEYTHTKTSDSNYTAIYTLGHATTIQDMEIVLEENDAAGINAVIIPLPKMFGHTHAVDGRAIDQINDDHIENALGPDSPIWKEIPSHHKVSLISHSSSGASFERVAKRNEDFSAFARAKYSNIIHQGAMLETVDSSFLFDSFNSNLYTVASITPWLKDRKVGSTPIDINHLKIPSNTDMNAYQNSLRNNARHGQAHYYKSAAQRHLRSVIQDNEIGSHFQQMERTFISSKKEDAACYLTVQHYANVLAEGAVCDIRANGAHNFMINTDSYKENSAELDKECAAFRKELIGVIKNDKQPRLSMEEYEAFKKQSQSLPENNWLVNFTGSRKQTTPQPQSDNAQAAASAPALANS